MNNQDPRDIKYDPSTVPHPPVAPPETPELPTPIIDEERFEGLNTDIM